MKLKGTTFINGSPIVYTCVVDTEAGTVSITGFHAVRGELETGSGDDGSARAKLVGPWWCR